MLLLKSKILLIDSRSKIGGIKPSFFMGISCPKCIKEISCKEKLLKVTHSTKSIDLNFLPRLFLKICNSKTVDWRVIYYVYFNWPDFFVLKDIQNVSVQLILSEIRLKNIFTN